jgi:GT2 family glycosyltransferase
MVGCQIKNKDTDERHPLVSIIIPNYNGSKLIKRFMPLVFETNYPNFEVIFVDDGSTDNSVKLVKSLFGSDFRLNIIHHGKNLGLSSARNSGIKKAKGKYIAFLDVDIEVTPKWLVEIVDVLENDKSIGVAMCKILDGYDRKRIQWLGQLIIPFTGLTVNKGYGEVDEKIYDKIEEVYACLNAAVIRREVFERTELIDDKMAYWWEDIDFEWRVWLSGFKEVLVPTSVVYHLSKPPKGRMKMYKWTGISTDFISKGFLRFFLKNYEVKNIVRYLPWAFVFYFTRSLIHLRKRDISVLFSLTGSIFTHLRNLSDILRERYKIQHLIRRIPDGYLLQKFAVRSLFVFYKKYHLGSQHAYKKYFLQLILSHGSDDEGIPPEGV